MNNTKLLIDYREKEIIEKLSNSQINKEIVPLDLGDFHYITSSQLYLVIERKTEVDLNASIKDGRWREQKERLDLLKKQGIEVLFIIEQVDAFKKTNLDFNILHGAIINTLLRDDYKILFSYCVENTVEYLETIYKKIEKGEFEKERGGHIEVVSSNLKKKMSKENFMCITLSSIPRVSINTAKKICEKYKNLNELIEAFKIQGAELLAEIQITDKKKIGKKLSSDIYNFLL